MIPRKVGEQYHHTPDQVRDYLATALQILAERKLDADTHDHTLAQLVATLAGKQVFHEHVQPPPIFLPANKG